MFKLPPGTNEIGPGHTCDVCKEANAKYYNLIWYIHICSVECYETFIRMYNREIDDFIIVELQPDTEGDANNATL